MLDFLSKVENIKCDLNHTVFANSGWKYLHVIPRTEWISFQIGTSIDKKKNTLYMKISVDN